MRRAWRLEQWILGIIIPVLILIALGLGFAVYRGLYLRVLNGFDQKLLAATSTLAAFIDGDEHQALLEPIPMRALAWDRTSSRLYGADRLGKFYVVDPATGEAEPKSDLRPELVHVLGPANYGQATDGRQLWAVGPSGLLHWPSRDASQPAESEKFAFGFRSRNDPGYRKYLEPMRAIQNSQNVTYIYSQVLLKPYEIAYILDASEGDDQSLIGGKDVVPPEDYEDARRVMEKGEIRVNRIRKFERWGLLKVAAGPIRNRLGECSATVGVDVNISIIQKKTQVALLQVALLSALLGLAAAGLSVLMAQRLTRPLKALKKAALIVAAGSYGNQVRVQNPRELSRVAREFNQLSADMKDTFSRLSRENAAREAEQSRRWLVEYLGFSQNSAIVREFSPGRDPLSFSGHVQAADLVLAWVTDQAGSQLPAARTRARLKDLAMRLLRCESPPLDDSRLLDKVARFLPGTIILFDASSGELILRAPDGLRRMRLAPGATVEFRNQANGDGEFQIRFTRLPENPPGKDRP